MIAPSVNGPVVTETRADETSVSKVLSRAQKFARFELRPCGKTWWTRRTVGPRGHARRGVLREISEPVKNKNKTEGCKEIYTKEEKSVYTLPCREDRFEPLHWPVNSLCTKGSRRRARDRRSGERH